MAPYAVIISERGLLQIDAFGQVCMYVGVLCIAAWMHELASVC